MNDETGHSEPHRPWVVLMGVAGSGKSTVGRRLSAELSVPFVEGDDFHDERARRRIAAGLALTDEDRRPWLARIHRAMVDDAHEGFVVACSALRRSYRVQLARGLEGICFLALVAPPAVLLARLRSRHGHLAGPALLPSQLDTLELDEDVTIVDADRPVDDVLAETRRLAEAAPSS